jgi:hypothetical protein
MSSELLNNNIVIANTLVVDKFKINKCIVIVVFHFENQSQLTVKMTDGGIFGIKHDNISSNSIIKARLSIYHTITNDIFSTMIESEPIIVNYDVVHIKLIKDNNGVFKLVNSI